MVPDHYDPTSGFLKLSVHSWLIKRRRQRILIDACVGNHKPRPTLPMWHLMETRYLERMAEAGIRPEQIDMVMCTHLHLDHVGWNTRLDNGRWVPTFPNARYIFSREDYDHFLKLDSDPEKGPVTARSATACMPVVEAGLAQMVRAPMPSTSTCRSTRHPAIRLVGRHQPCLARPARAVLWRRPAPRGAGLSSGMEQFRLRRRR